MFAREYGPVDLTAGRLGVCLHIGVVSRVDGTFYPTTKIIRVKGDLLGAAGDAGDCTRFMDWAKHDFSEKKRPKFTVPADDRDAAVLLILNAEGIFTMSTSDPYPIRAALWRSLGNSASRTGRTASQ